MILLTPHQLKALNYKKHVSLTANAGSGKTFVLTKRFLEIILNEDISLRNIAAITFTEKAASELYKQIAEQINDRLGSEQDPKIKKRLEAIRRQLVSANISTIHSFCINILKEFPVEAGIDANFTPIDEQLADELIEIAVEETINHSFPKDGSHKFPDSESRIKYLIRIFSSKKLLAKELFKLLKNRKNVLTLAETVYSKNEEEISKFFFSTFNKYADKIINQNKKWIVEYAGKVNNKVLKIKKDSDKAGQAGSLIKEINNEAGLLKLISLIKKLKNLMLTGEGEIRISGYLPKDYHDELRHEIRQLKKFFEEVGALEADENREKIEMELARFGKVLFHFFKEALEKYELKKGESSYLDFEDILLLTKKLLNLEEVKYTLSEKFKFIMIDEYQDTNELQYHIFLPILDYLKKGNLFVVGDEKQSIYMFRDAELEIFNKTKTDIANAEVTGALLSLPDSFRMNPSICLFTNSLFKILFENPNQMFNEVEHTNLVCARSDQLPGKVEFLLNETGELSNDDNEGEEFAQRGGSVDGEAELVAQRIIKLMFYDELGSKLDWNDIAILCRKRKAFRELEKAFLKYGIPFNIIGGRGFFQQQLVYDIYNYFAFLINPQNDSALVGILRSPFFSISDSTLFEISQIPAETYWEKLIAFSNSSDEAKGVVEKISKMRQIAHSTGIPLLLRKILIESDYLAVVASRFNGQQELANIEKLVSKTINFAASGFKSLFDYAAYLQDAINKTEDEGQAAVSEAGSSVKIMTLHQAKGLEFKSVFLYKCSEAAQRDNVKTRGLNVSKEFGLLTKLPLNNDFFSEYKPAPVVSIYNLINKKKYSAELKRLFYVGVTRAKDYLFISASHKNFKFKEDSFMGLLTNAANLNFEKNFLEITDDLEFLLFDQGKYTNKKKTLTLSIPVIKSLDIDPLKPVKSDGAAIKKILCEEISDSIKDEIVSATKISIFNQCPLKYQLTYEYGYSTVFSNYKNWTHAGDFDKKLYEFNIHEDSEAGAFGEPAQRSNLSRYAELRGRLIHKILQMEIDPEQLKSFIAAQITEMKKLKKWDETERREFVQSVENVMKNYFESSAYQRLKNYHNYRNELELYSKEKNYFLYGIIDKLVINKNEAIIIDYKSDDIDVNEINVRAENYFIQLEFYAYVVSRLYKEISDYKLMLIFLNYPDKAVQKNVNAGDLSIIREKITQTVMEIRENKFRQNLSHCKDCMFAFKENICIKSFIDHFDY